MKLKYLARHIDERLVTEDLPLMSVSKTLGVLPRSDISETPGRAEDISNYKTCKPGDLVINRMSAYQGALGIARQTGAVSPDYMVLRFGSEVDPKFAGHLFKSHYMNGEMTSRVKGIGSVDSGTVRTPRLSWSELSEVDVAIPDRSTQARIAEFLDRETAQIDILIAKQEQLIATLGERRTALIRESISIGLQADAKRRWSGVDWLGDIPAHWRAMPLKWCARLQTGSTPKDEMFSDNETAPWLRPDDLDESGIPSSATRYFSAQAVAALPPARAGSTLLCGIGATLGKVGLVAEKVHFNQQITSVTSTARDKFMFYVLLAAKGELRALSVGNTMQILNNERLGSLMVPLPPDDEQDSIVEHLDRQTWRIDRLVSASRQAVKLLQERRQALISAAVTGMIDVRG